MMKGAGFIIMFVAGFFYNGYKFSFSDITIITSQSINITNPQLSKYVINVQALNKGPDVSYFIHPVSMEESQHLSNITAFEGMKQLQVLQTDEPVEDDHGYIYYKIELASPLKADTILELQIEYVLSNWLKISPVENSQHQSRLMMWKGSSNYVSVYPIESDETFVILANGSKVLAFTGTKMDDKIFYGPTKDIPPLTYNNVSIHYEYRIPSFDLKKASDFLFQKWYNNFSNYQLFICLVLIPSLVFVGLMFFTNSFLKSSKPHDSVKVK